ncbi:unnamed protein product, partial [Prorocentrum cordatum]
DQQKRNKRQQEKEEEMEKKRELLKQEPGETRRRKPKANRAADNLSRGIGAFFVFLAVVLLGLCVPYDSGEATAPGVNATNASSPGAGK